MSNNLDNINKVLFFRLGAIGDVVHTTATYQTLRQQKKNIIIDYLTSSVVQDLLNNDPMLREIIALSDRSYEGLFRLALELSEERYDLVVNLQPSLKSMFFTQVLKAGKTIKYKKFKPKKCQSHIHAVKNFYQTLEPYMPEATMPDRLKIYLNKDITSWAKHKLESERATHSIGIIPGVSMARKNKLWPMEYWKTLLNYITNERNINVIIFGGTNEDKMARELQDVNQSRIKNFCGKLTISQTAGILSMCMLVIGGDTGPSHIATAVGPKVIGLYGPTANERSGLYGPGHELLTSSFECLCCEKATCSYTKNPDDYAKCMKELKPEQVIAKLGI